jgi:hypothetical protein
MSDKQVKSGRRHFLQRLGLGSGALVSAGLAGCASSQSTTTGSNDRLELRKESLVVDIAVLGHTNFGNDGGAANKIPGWQNFRQSDSRGSVYYFEGLVYPGGTIPEPSAEEPDGVVWDFKVEPTGTFFNRGWILINNKSDGPYVPRPHPHLLSHADYFLGGVVGPDNLTPKDMLQSVGLENGIPPNDVVLRALTGGSGRFANVRGQVSQRRIGRNTTGLIGMPAPPDFLPPAPNYRLTFELWL